MQLCGVVSILENKTIIVDMKHSGKRKKMQENIQGKDDWSLNMITCLEWKALSPFL